MIAVGAVAAVVLALLAPAAPPAAASTVVEGEVLRLVSVQDRAAMAGMRAGAPVAWDVEVSASRPDGRIDLTLEADATPDAFVAAVRACGAASADCADAPPILRTPLGADEVEIGSQSSAERAWYRVEIVLVEDVARARADVVFRAAGLGDDVASEGGVLPETGTAPRAWTLLLGAGLLAAVAVAVASRGRARA